jgi:uncharacterized protein YjbI with pentapeptide repeats
MLSAEKAKKVKMTGARMTVQELLERYERGERDFRGANLIGAGLFGVNLSRADLSRAKLSRANLRGANLTGSCLNRANLSSANLPRANLTGTDLRNTDLRNTDLRWCRLIGADLSGAAGLPQTAAESRDLRATVAYQIEHYPETHCQSAWHHVCGTKHCVFGWIIVRSGKLGRYLEQQLSIQTAAHLLMGGKVRPSHQPGAQSKDILSDLRNFEGLES